MSNYCNEPNPHFSLVFCRTGPRRCVGVQGTLCHFISRSFLCLSVTGISSYTSPTAGLLVPGLYILWTCGIPSLLRDVMSLCRSGPERVGVVDGVWSSSIEGSLPRRDSRTFSSDPRTPGPDFPQDMSPYRPPVHLPHSSLVGERLYFAPVEGSQRSRYGIYFRY